MSSQEFPYPNAANMKEAAENMRLALSACQDTKYLVWCVNWMVDGFRDRCRRTEQDILRHRAFGRDQDAQRAQEFLDQYRQNCWPLIAALEETVRNMSAEEFARDFAASVRAGGIDTGRRPKRKDT